MSDQVREIKERVDIVSVIGQRVQLSPAGKYFKGLCPFHSEKSPSFFVSPEIQSFKCYGCGKGGDVYTFLQEYEGMTFPEALQAMADKAGIELERYQSTDKDTEIKELKELLGYAKEYYHYLLTKHDIGKEAREYLKERGLPWSIVEKYELGYSPQSWQNVSRYLQEKKNYKIEQIVRAGLSLESRKSAGVFYDRFRGRLMFPLVNFRGDVVGFSGRVLDPEVKEAKYINSPETEVYHKRELLYGLHEARVDIRKANKVLLVEGEFDVLSSIAAGVRYTAALKGSALTEQQLSYINRLTRNIILALDADTAGDKATKRGIALAEKLNMNVSVLSISGGKDPDDLARSDPEKWKELVKQTQSIYEFYINSSLQKFDPETGQGKKKITEQVVPVLARISNQVEQDHYNNLLAKKLKISVEVIKSEIQRFLAEDNLPKKTRAQIRQHKAQEDKKQQEKEDRLEKMEEDLVRQWLQLSDKDKNESLKDLQRLKWKHTGISRLIEKAKDYAQSQEFTVKQFAKSLPEELQQLVAHLYLKDAPPDSPVTIEAVRGIIIPVKRLQTKEQIQDIRRQIAEIEENTAPNADDSERLAQLQQDVSKLIRQLHTL